MNTDKHGWNECKRQRQSMFAFNISRRNIFYAVVVSVSVFIRGKKPLPFRSFGLTLDFVPIPPYHMPPAAGERAADWSYHDAHCRTH